MINKKRASRTFHIAEASKSVFKEKIEKVGQRKKVGLEEGRGEWDIETTDIIHLCGIRYMILSSVLIGSSE